MIGGLNGLVSDYISNGFWEFPYLLQLRFPALCDIIEQVPIASGPLTKDELIWSATPAGELTAKAAFQFLRPHASIVDWGKSIWSKFIMPRICVSLEDFAWACALR